MCGFLLSVLGLEVFFVQLCWTGFGDIAASLNKARGHITNNDSFRAHGNVYSLYHQPRLRNVPVISPLSTAST
jgi:hypothetical protein